MPELPEVETVRRGVASMVVGVRIASVTVRRRDIVATELDPIGGFSRAGGIRGADGRGRAKPGRVPGAWLLAGVEVTSVERLGKQLALVGASGRCVVVHLGMSGQLLVAGRGERLPTATWGSAHDHVVWRLEGRDGSSAGRMVFRDPRRFGGVFTSPDREHMEGVRWAALGPDALTVTGEQLAQRAGRSARATKAALLDQRVLAGVGNIYADEALFRAGVHPMTPTSAMGPETWEAVAARIREVLVASIEAGGSTLRDYTDAQGRAGVYALSHAVYGRAGMGCVACGAVLETGVVAQRTTVWCPSCQELGRAHG